MATRTNWYSDHPPACTCAFCNDEKQIVRWIETTGRGRDLVLSKSEVDAAFKVVAAYELLLAEGFVVTPA